MDSDIYKQLGANQQAIDTLLQEVHALREQVQELANTISEAKGGWTVLLSVASFGALIGGAVIAVAQRLWGH